MAGSWLNALENLQGQFLGLPEVEKLFEKDFLWVDETFVLASGLFKKDTTQEDSENTNENEGPGTPLGVPPVLLPTTPGVSSDSLTKLNELQLLQRIPTFYLFLPIVDESPYKFKLDSPKCSY